MRDLRILKHLSLSTARLEELSVRLKVLRVKVYAHSYKKRLERLDRAIRQWKTVVEWFRR